MRDRTYPDEACSNRRETIMPRTPAQQELIGLPLRHSDIRHRPRKHWKHRKEMLINFLTWRHMFSCRARKPLGMSNSPQKTLSFTFDVDVCFSGGGDTLGVVSFAAELNVLVHTCKWNIREDIVVSQLCGKWKTTNPQGQDRAKCFDSGFIVLQYLEKNWNTIQPDTFWWGLSSN